jgi:Protein of unknown function (DUF5818)
MRKAYLITAILLLSCAWVVAQNSTPPAPDSSQPSQQNPSTQQPDTSQTSAPQAGTSDHAAHTVEGCVGGSAGSYTLTDASGKTYQLAGDTSKLADHVGHTVQISGTEESAAPGAASSAGGGSTLNVKKVKMVSASCATK